MKNTKQLLIPMALFGMLAIVFLAPAAFSQDDMTQVPIDGFTKLERPRVAFEHDAHNEKAELDDCVVCHHGKTDDGKIDMENSSDGETCASCHPENAPAGVTPLMRAYHRQCVTCHETSLKGPVACGECHKK